MNTNILKDNIYIVDLGNTLIDSVGYIANYLNIDVTQIKIVDMK